jgi:hypothetical protein
MLASRYEKPLPVKPPLNCDQRCRGCTCGCTWHALFGTCDASMFELSAGQTSTRL